MSARAAAQAPSAAVLLDVAAYLGPGGIPLELFAGVKDAARGMHALVDARLGEPGASQGMTSAAFQEVLDEAMLEWMTVPGEGWHAFAGAAFGALNELASRLPRGSDAVVSTSAGVIAALVTKVLDAAPETAIQLNRVMVNASLTVIAASPRRLSVITFNDHAHLIGEPGLVTFR